MAEPLETKMLMRAVMRIKAMHMGRPVKPIPLRKSAPEIAMSVPDGPVEKSLELAAEKAENNVGAHAAHLLDHGFVDVLDRFKAARRDAIRDAGNTEEEKENRDETFEEQRSDEGMSVFGKNACKETDGEDGNIEHNGKTGTMKSFYFKGGHFLDGLVFIFAVIDGEPRFHDPS